MISLTRKLIVLALSIVTSVALAYSLFGLGFMVCTTPQATSLIGGTFSGWEHATYPEEDMAQIAERYVPFQSREPLQKSFITPSLPLFRKINHRSRPFLKQDRRKTIR